MKPSSSTLALSLAIVPLVALASGLGLLVPGLYRDPAWLVPQARGQPRAMRVVFGAVMLVFKVTLALLILSRGKRVQAGLLLGIGFLVAVTPLGFEVLPNAVLAIGLWRLVCEPYPTTAIGELRGWWRARKQKRQGTAPAQEARS